MWIVRVALKRPYTFVVLAILILILGTLSIFRTPTDIFPNIDIPVVSIIWNYTGLSPTEMSNRIITLQERNLTTIVNDIEHIESQSLNGIAVIKVFFHPGVNISMAIAQIAGQSHLGTWHGRPVSVRRQTAPGSSGFKHCGTPIERLVSS